MNGPRRTALLVAGALALVAGGLPAQQRTPPKKAPVKAPAKTPASKKADSATVAPKADTTPPPPRVPIGSITGTVFDSLHGIPLEAATVSIEGTDRLSLTTVKGIFRLDSIPPGTHRLKVDHIVLDSLGIAMLTAPFDIKDGDASAMQLSIPSAATLVEVSCPPARRNLGPGAVIGRLLDADTDQPVEGARVSVAWLEMSLNAGLRKIPRVREALSGGDGVYRICGLPANFEGTLQAIMKGVTTSEVRVKAEGRRSWCRGSRSGTPIRSWHRTTAPRCVARRKRRPAPPSRPPASRPATRS
ncbi:MAG: carboxypeptidase regulatory-like domain-containing protein [Gemmatimonadetes bacterium]|nr:carboxypeptidase regulatory-like domain-containing protein [Gemmatimonadota bacterium]